MSINASKYAVPNSENMISIPILSRGKKELQIEVMREWFYANYVDPIHESPYESAEGGYVFIWGGPYDASEELQYEFGEYISLSTIEELASELNKECQLWTKHSVDEPDGYLFSAFSLKNKPIKTYKKTISSIIELSEMDITSKQKLHLNSLLYVNTITAIETYLSDAFISIIKKGGQHLKKYVETEKEFITKKISLSEIYKYVNNIEKTSIKHLLDMVWHNLPKVKTIYKSVLNVNFPEDLKSLTYAINTRHDIVHRNGKSKDDVAHKITTKDLRGLIKLANEFVEDIDSQISEL